MTWRFWRQRRGEGVQLSVAALPGALYSALADALLHRRFRKCRAELNVNRPSNRCALRAWFVHAAVMGGFLAMLLATTFHFMFKPIGSPVPPGTPCA